MTDFTRVFEIVIDASPTQAGGSDPLGQPAAQQHRARLPQSAVLAPDLLDRKGFWFVLEVLDRGVDQIVGANDH